MNKLVAFCLFLAVNSPLWSNTTPETALVCNLFVDAGQDQSVCNIGDQVQLSGMVSDPSAIYSWTPSTGLSNPNSLNPTVTVSGTTTYTLEAQYVDPVNLVNNGDFNLGAVGFTSNYIPGTGGTWGLLSNEGQYAVANDPSSTHTNFSPCSDHTGDAVGNMMVINGAAVANQSVWCQTVTVSPGTNYEFTSWVAMVINSSPAILQFSINGSLVGGLLNANPTPCAWIPFSAQWNSGGSTTAEICIVNQNTNPSGNDFALDDISFNEVCTATDEVTITLNEPASTFITETVCADNNCVLLEGQVFCGTGLYVVDLFTTEGCDSTLFLTIEENTPGIIFPPIEELSCITELVPISPFISSNGQATGFQWSGPNGFSAVDQNIIVSEPGAYLLTVEVMLNGTLCTVQDVITVFENIDLPNADAGADVIMACGDTFPITLDASNSDSGPGIDYFWTGPGVSSSDVMIDVTMEGIYTLLVVNSITGCQNVDLVSVTAGIGMPEISPTGGLLNCNATSIALDGASQTAGVTYSWTGPNSFNSSMANPTVAVPGYYYLTVSAGANCSAVDSTLVTQDTLSPMPIIIGADTLTCDLETIDLIVNPADPLVSYVWSGPAGFAATSDTVTILDPGSYSVVATAVNGCTATTTAEVVADENLPEATASGGLLNCTDSTLTLNGSSATANVSLAWTGPNGYNSNLPNPGISIPGEYVFSVAAMNGCTTLLPVQVSIDTISPALTTTDVALDCSTSTIALVATTDGIEYNWTGPGSFTSTMLNPLASEEGEYNLAVTAANGCTATASAMLTLNEVAVDLQLSGDDLDCLANSVELSASSSFTIDQYQWSSDNGFTSTAAAPMVGQAGTYVLEVFTVAGCTGVDSIVVSADENLPDISATGGSIFCDPATLNLAGNSLTAGVTYLWEGPGGFSTTDTAPTVTVPGDYTFSVSAANGCVAVQEVAVVLENELPNIIAVGGTIFCDPDELTLQGNSTTADVDYLWEGPNGFSSNMASPTISIPGSFTLSITGENGCVSSETVAVVLANELPNITAVGGTIFCDPDELTLQGNSTTADVDYLWEGPNGFSSNIASPTISTAGNFTLSITAENGCVSSETVAVVLDTDVPSVNATGGSIGCDNLPVQLNAGAATATAFSWTGPNGFISTDPDPIVSTIGDYFLLVTGANGCTNMTQVEVTAVGVIPDVVVDGGTVDCSMTPVVLTAMSSDVISNYSWSGPGGFISNEANPGITQAGDYFVTITNDDGCMNSGMTTVDQDGDLPSFSLDNIISIDCNTPNAQLNLLLDDPGNTVQWSGPNGFTSQTIQPSIATAGNYAVTITAANGCESIGGAVVNGDFIAPDFAVSNDDIDCTSPLAELNATVVNGIEVSSVEWLGPNGTLVETGLMAETNQVGNYTVTILGVNGCSSSQNFEVNGSTDLPTVQSANVQLDCDFTMSILSLSSDQTLVSYNWTGPNGFQSNLPNPVIDAPGVYTFTGTTALGCLGSTVANVTENIVAPTILNIAATEIDCQNPNATILLNSNDPSANISWTGPNNFIGSGTNVLASAAGEYFATVTSANGCIAMQSIEVIQDNELPALSFNIPSLDCNNPMDNLIASANIPGGTFEWMYQNSTVGQGANLSVSNGGVYTAQYILPGGCESVETIVVDADFVAPSLTLDGGEINCNQPTFELMPSTADNIVNWQWLGDNGFTAQAQQPEVNAVGNYTLTAVAANGCSSEVSATVTEDFVSPDFSIVGGTIDCINLDAQITAVGNGANHDFSWTGPAGFNSNAQQATAPTGGIYELVITGGNGCSQTLSIEVAEDNNIPLFTVFGSTLNCFNPEVTLGMSGANIPGDYLWTGPNGFSSSQEDIMVTEPGEYSLQLTATNGCVNENNATVDSDFSVPNITAYGGHLSCQDMQTTISFDVPQSGSFLWTGPDGSQFPSVSAIVSEPGIYELQFIAGDNGCETVEEVEVTQDDPLTSALLLTQPACPGEQGQLVVENTIGGVAPYVYSIDGGQTFSPAVPSGSLTAGAYNFVIQDAGECSWDTSVVVNHVPQLYIQLLTSIEINYGEQETLQPSFNFPQSTIQSVQWLPSTGLSCDDCLYPEASPSQNTSYTLNVTTVDGCQTSSTIFLRVNNDQSIFIPNVFSPNGDGSNDAFTVFADPSKVQQVDQLIIYDRWGEEVYRVVDFPVNDYGFGWDGVLNGEMMNPAVFVYYVELTFLDGTVGTFKGDVTLVR